MEELTTTFRYNDAVIRNMVIRRDEAVLEESLIMKAEREDKERKARYQERQDNVPAAPLQRPPKRLPRQKSLMLKPPTLRNKLCHVFFDAESFAALQLRA